MAFRYQGQPFSGAFSGVAAVLRRRGDRRAATAARLRSIFETPSGGARSQDCNAALVQLQSELIWSVVELRTHNKPLRKTGWLASRKTLGIKATSQQAAGRYAQLRLPE